MCVVVENGQQNPDIPDKTLPFKLAWKSLTKIKTCQFKDMWNKKSAESDVAPAGVKSYKFLFVLKKKSILQYSRNWWVSL